MSTSNKSRDYNGERVLIVFHGLETGIEKDKLIWKILKTTFDTFGTRISDIQVLWNGVAENLIELYEFDHEYIGEAYFGVLKVRLITQYHNHTLSKPIKLADFLDFNFNKHTLKIAIWNDRSQVPMLKNIFKAISKSLNFTLDLIYIELSSWRRLPDININLLRNRTIDCTYNFCNKEPYGGVSTSLPYSIVGLQTVFKPRRNFTLNSLMLSVVDEKGSIYIVICSFLICLLLIMQADRLKRDITRVILEVIGLFMGYPLTFPTRVDLLMVGFGMLGLLIRTIYLADYYKVLTINMFDEHPNELIELQNGKYKVIIPNFAFNMDVLLKSLPAGFQAEASLQTGQELLDSIDELPYFTGFLVDAFKVHFYMKEGLIDTRTHIMLHSFLNIHRCLHFQKDHPIKEMFDHYMDILKESGLMNHWSFVDLNRVRSEINKEPTQIILTDVWNAFILTGFGLFTSILVFLLEICIFKILAWRKGLCKFYRK